MGMIQRIEMGQKRVERIWWKHTECMREPKPALNTEGSSSIIKSIYVLPPSQNQTDSQRAPCDQMESSKGNI